MATNPTECLIKCAVCLEEGNLLKKPISLPCPTIRHIFCLPCIERWVNSGKTANHRQCPECKSDIFKKPLNARLLSLSDAAKRFLGFKTAPYSLCPIKIISCPDDKTREATEQDLEVFMKKPGANNHSYATLDGHISLFVIGVGIVLSTAASLSQALLPSKNVSIKVLASSARIPLTVLLLAPLIKAKTPETRRELQIQNLFRLIALFITCSLWGCLDSELVIRTTFLALAR